MAEATTDQEKAWLGQHLRTALTNLYNPTVLRSSPLAGLLGLEKDGDRAMALRSVLLNAIEAMHPNQGIPRGSKTWRVYQVLRRRYTEQESQREVAMDLGLSTRQLQREEKDARDLLIDHLWDTYSPGERMPSLPAKPDAIEAEPEVETGATNEGTELTRVQELEWLDQSVAAEVTDLDALIQSAIETVQPLQDQMSLSLEYAPARPLPPIRVKAPLLRQALVTIIGAQAAVVPGGRISVRANATGEEVEIAIAAQPPPEQGDGPLIYSPEDVDMSQDLLRLCGGSMSMMLQRTGGSEPCLVADIRLPANRLTTVLVIDDNADALRLMERYLAGTRYAFVGAQSGRRGMELATELAPSIIVLDVMMPEQDGWALLGQLRAHPKTRGASIVVCTFLAQEQLALALGASAFIRKPVRRADLMAVLDRQLSPSQKGY